MTTVKAVQDRELPFAHAAAHGTELDVVAAGERGFGPLALTLANRREIRVSRIKSSTDLLPSYAWRVSQLVGVADVVLERLGAPWRSDDQVEDLRTRWLLELRGGLDAYAMACWALRFGYPLAAAALVRFHLERWTFNIASSHALNHRHEQEPFETYIARVWSTYLDTNQAQRVAAQWSTLSELLHGRPAVINGVPVTAGFDISGAQYARLASFIARAGEVPVRQVRGAIDTFARENLPQFGDSSYMLAPASAFPAKNGENAATGFLQVFGELLTDQFVESREAQTYVAWGATYRRIINRRASEPLGTASIVDRWMPIEERWARAIERARDSFARERRDLADDYGQGSVVARVYHYNLVAELSDVAAGLVDTPTHAQALRAAAAALHAAVALWLRDANESMVCARTIIESAARARTHRLKPTRAAKLEARGALSTPTRWLEAAGWKRLGAFTRALGEFCHLVGTTRTPGAFELLESIQVDPIPGHEIHTARGSALDLVINILTAELVETCSAVSAALGESVIYMAHMYGVDPLSEVEPWMNRAAAFLGHDFGDPLISAGTELDDELTA